jgi:tetratricopeptide (TPR) repeat protein
LAHFRPAGRDLALKTLRDEHLGDLAKRLLFLKELRASLRVPPHPFVVRTHGVESIRGRLYIAMEYVEPGADGRRSLEEHLRLAPPPAPGRSVRWAIQLCHAMEHLYASGIRCHRDLKPANVLIDARGDVKLTDLSLAGLARPRGRRGRRSRVLGAADTLHGGAFGTPEFMSPEQRRDASRCDERSDIYSCGVLLRQLEAGAAGSPLAPIYERCLQRRPRDRFGSFAVLREVLEGILWSLFHEQVRVSEARPLEPWEWTNRGLGFYLLGCLDEAASCYDRALAAAPQLLAALYNRALLAEDRGRLEFALAGYDAILALAPDHAAAWNNRGRVLGRLGRTAAARDSIARAHALDPKDPSVRRNQDLLEDSGEGTP